MINDINDNDNFLSENINDNEINVNDRNKVSSRNHKMVEAIASDLARRFGNDQYRSFYCKVAYNLPENIIYQNVETAFAKGKNPAKLFSFLCSKAMK